MSRNRWTVIQFVVFALSLWGTAELCRAIGLNRVIAAMLLLLEVLAIATLGNWVLAILSSTVASLAFSYYFIDAVGSFRLTTSDGAITFAVMAVTAIAGSRLAIRSQRRALEAIRRREEMDRMNQFGHALLVADSLAEAAGNAVRKVVELFALKGAVLRMPGAENAFQWGATVGPPSSVVTVDINSGSVLEMYGTRPSEEVGSTVGSIIRLVLERARSTEDRARLETIRRGEELHSTVLNAMAHNFRTPLTSIKAAASMLRGSKASLSESDRELAVVIDEEADRLNRLIAESLYLANLEAGRTVAKCENCSIPEIVGRVAARMAHYLEGREFIIELPEDLPPITGDRFLVEQMLTQVLDNAWKYSRPGAPIGIFGAVSGASVILTIWNKGCEIPENERERIFDRFYRGSRDRNRVEGAGLGLAIARTIAEACRGKIWLDAEPLGTAFRFQLPLGAAAALETEFGVTAEDAEIHGFGIESTGRLSDTKQHHITY